MQKNKKLNTLTLSGLMIGPILGSGIVLLPPLAIKILGDQAIIAWMIIMLLGGIFAYVFAKMSLFTSTNEGISLIIAHNLGPFFGELASNYLTMAVFFGPVAVVLTASEFISAMFVAKDYNHLVIAFIVLVLAGIVLLMDVAKMGRLSLLLSSLTALLLVIGGALTLLAQPVIAFPNTFPEAGKLGYTLLLLFWSIIGWEVIGNYIEDVENPQSTIMRAMKISLTAVILVYLISTFALQNAVDLSSIDTSASMTMGMILTPLFGDFSYFIMGVIAAGLCFCTLILFVGALARQVAERAQKGSLPHFFIQKKGERSPRTILLTLLSIHTLLLVFIYFSWITLEIIVGIANTFFIGNALLGLLTSLRCMTGIVIKGCVVLLILILCVLMSYSPLVAWVLFMLVSAGSVFKYFLGQTANSL
ncbi:MAG: amino acid permease-associated protein [Clostridia bacterium]|jgi:APA family basic amino acid/polyamine antiporter|nr:amino acid permease-associated protein [Clostridia bacterium]